VAVAADGSAFAVAIATAEDVRAPLRVAVLVDRSGSMGDVASLLPGRITTHGAVRRGLAAAAASLVAGDRLAVWEFNEAVAPVGMVVGPRDGTAPDLSAIERLGDPGGGTEIGGALESVIAGEPESDILLVTDGRSHALDVSALARHARRIGVVLVGEGSLEANVGHLAALTGGDIFVASGECVGDALGAAMASLRAARGAAQAGEVRRSGAVIAWRPVADAPRAPEPMNDALVALAAGLEIRDVPEERATELAARHGLVTHLTSLVLVDEAGAIQEGLPALRKVALPRPAIRMRHRALRMFEAPPSADTAMFVGSSDSRDESGSGSAWYRRADPGRPGIGRAEAAGDRRDMLGAPAAPSGSAAGPSLARLASMLDWNADPAGLAAGNAAALVTRRPEDQPRFDERLAALVARPDVEALARGLGMSALQVAILMLACLARERDRTAARLLRGAGLGQSLTRLLALISPGP
jgi:hypothetical protein